MENASKSILIAGSVIIALALVSIGFLILNSARNSADLSGIQIDNIVKEQYNSQYLIYDKNYVTGIEVKQCISDVLYNNSLEIENGIMLTGVTVDSKEYIGIVNNNGKKTVTDNIARLTSDTTKHSVGDISNSNRYTTQIILGEDGLVEKIIFTKMNRN